MMPQSLIFYNLTEVGFNWKIWQSTCMMIGSILFFIGSALYFHCFQKILDADLYASFSFAVGSFINIFGQGRQLIYHTELACKQKPQVYKEEELIMSIGKTQNTRYFVYYAGMVIYLVGCTLCIPVFDTYQLGNALFMFGFLLMCSIQIHKLIQIIKSPISIRQMINESPLRALLQISSAISEWCYFIGSVVFFTPEKIFLGVDYWTCACILYCSGGFASIFSSTIYLIELRRLNLLAKRDQQIEQILRPKNKIEIQRNRQIS